MVRIDIHMENEKGRLSTLVKSVFKRNKRKGAKPQRLKECCAPFKFSCAESPAFSSHEPIVQQPAGQLFLNYNTVTLSGVKCPYLPDDLKDSLPTIEELEKELGELKVEVSRDE